MKSIKRLNILLRPFRFQILLALLMLFALTSIDMIFPEVIRRIIDIGVKGGEASYMVASAGFIVGLGLVKAVINFGNRYMAEWLSHNIAFDLRNKLYNHIQRLSFSYHDHTASGQLISRCIEDVRSLQNFTGHGFLELTRVVIIMVAIIIILFITNPLLAVISLLPLVPLLILTTRFGKRVGKMFLAVDQSLGELSSRLQENVNGVQVVRAFTREKFEIERFVATNRELNKHQLGVVKEMARVMPTSNLLVGFSTLLILWFGGNMVLNDQLTLGQLVAFNSYILMLSGPAQQLSWLINAALSCSVD